MISFTQTINEIMNKKTIAMAFSLLSLFSCKAFTNLDPDAFQARLAGDGTARLEGGVLSVEIPRKLGYLWLKIDGIGK